MGWIPVVIAIFVVIYVYLSSRNELDSIKRAGVKATGTVIQNHEVRPNSRLRLGGNINKVIIQFTTEQGQEITGAPVNDLITQYELIVPSTVGIVYSSEDPQKFFIESIDR